MQIEMWDIERPKDYPKNARKWSKHAVEKVGQSIKTYGWRQPVVVDKNEVIVIGHLRRSAGRSIGEKQCPVHVAADLTAAQIRGLRLADNRTNQESAWDDEKLMAELAELREMGYDLSTTGFDMSELDSYLQDPLAQSKADKTPDLPEHPVTQVGDLWVVGKHLVLCGDATQKDAVSRACGPHKPFLMVTDPPYGVDYDPMWREDAGLGEQKQVGKVANDDQFDWTQVYKNFMGDVAYVWHAGVHAGDVVLNLAAAGFYVRSQIIWAKQHFAMSRGHYHWQHEPCWYAVRKGRKSNWNGDRTQSTIWEVANLGPFGGNTEGEKKTGHGTQKPVELMRRPIVNHTKAGDVVFDPFLGSGTTIMAAQLTGRICCGIDVDPRYTDVAVLRWQEYTGHQATLDGDGRTFSEVKTERFKGMPEPVAAA